MRAKRPQTRQLSFREDEALVARIEAAAVVEDLSVADFVRKVFRFGFRSYELSGSLYALRTRLEIYEKAQTQVELEREVESNLDVEVKKKRRYAGRQVTA